MNIQKIIDKFEAAQDALVLQSSDLSLETIAQMVASGAIDVSPRYQRRDRWEIISQSALIESFLLNVPVPPVYLAEDDFGTYSVIDGKQRITTIHKYLRNDFPLTRLEKFLEVEGLKFSELPKPLQNALSIRPYLRVVTLLKQTDTQLKYEVFTRLNTGGEPLLPQEIRNALYRGPFNNLLFQLSGSNFLRQQLKISTDKETPYKEMQDVEMVLRFLCMTQIWESFEGDMRGSLDKYAAHNQNLKPAKIKIFENKFITALSRCEILWGKDAFKRHEGRFYRDQFMSALYDAQMIAVSELTDAKFKSLTLKISKIAANSVALFKDQDFVDSVRVSTNSPSKVIYRISKIKKMLSEIS